jgi:hypothetical protein
MSLIGTRYTQEAAKDMIQWAANAVDEPFDAENALYSGASFGGTKTREQGFGPNAAGDADVLIQIERYDGYDMHGVRQQTEFDLNGLFKQKFGSIAVPTALYTKSLNPKSPLFAKVRVQPSPDRINDVQRMLGRTPGVDAFQLTRVPDMTHYTPGEGLLSFANKEVIVSDYFNFNPDLTFHDTNPADHVQSWLSLAPSHIAQIADRASALAEEHGERIHEDQHSRPKSVSEFAYGMDGLGDVTRYPFISALGNLTTSRLEALTPSGLVDCFEEVDVKVLRSAGLIPELTSLTTGSEQRLALQQFSASLLVHLANTFVALEELQPNPRLGKPERAARVKGLVALKNLAQT